MTEAEKAWLACAIDGEGFIGVYDRLDPRTGWRYRRLNIGICNTDLRFVIEAARLLENPKLYENRRTDPAHKGRKLVYQARQLNRLKVVEILVAIRPYLLIKGAKADKAIAIVKNGDWSRRRTPEQRRKASERMKTVWADGSFSGARGKHWNKSEAERERMRERSRATWKRRKAP